MSPQQATRATLEDDRLYSREDLTDAPEVTPEQAAENRRRGCGLRKPRPARSGRLAVSEATFDRWVANGFFPAPLKLGRLSRWRGRVVRAWIEHQKPKQLSAV